MAGNEQNRTEQNRTEQNRTEQNRTEQNRTEQNRAHSLPRALHTHTSHPLHSEPFTFTHHIHCTHLLTQNHDHTACTLHFTHYTLMLPAFEWGGMLECTIVGSLSGSPLSGIDFGSRFPSLRDDHFPRFRRWRPTLTMFKYIYTSTPSRAHQDGSTSVTIHVHIFVFDSTRLVHLQEDRLNGWRPSDNHIIYVHTHAPHHAHQHLHRYEIRNHLDPHAITFMTYFDIHLLHQDRPTGAS